MDNKLPITYPYRLKGRASGGEIFLQGKEDRRKKRKKKGKLEVEKTWRWKGKRKKGKNNYGNNIKKKYFEMEFNEEPHNIRRKIRDIHIKR